MDKFGIANLWAQGDTVLHLIALVLLAMSVLSWVVMLGKGLDLLRLRRAARRAKTFWYASDWDTARAALGDPDGDPFALLADTAKQASQHGQAGAAAALHETLDLSDWVTRCLKGAIDDAQHQLQSGLAVLASVGSTAPFVGLLGTVWGIYHALIGIGASGSATLDQVAGPVGEALIMTACGLFVAIPAVLGFNAISRGNRMVAASLNRFAADLHAYCLTGARLSQRQA